MSDEDFEGPDMLQDSWVTFHPSQYMKFTEIPEEYMDKDGNPSDAFSIRCKAEVGLGDPTVCLYFYARDMVNHEDLDPFLAVEMPFELLDRMTAIFGNAISRTEEA